MKSRIMTCIIAMTLFAALAIPVSQAADDERDQHHHRHHHYKLIDLGTFGGPSSSLATFNGSNAATNQVLNNRGTVVGWGDTSTLDPFASNPLGCLDPPDCFLPLAFQ